MFKKDDKQFYRNLAKRELSDQEIFEAKGNFVGFFDLLYRIDKRNEEKKKAEITKRSIKTSDNED